MRWKTEKAREWYRVFAYMPVVVGDEWVWWEWYERKVCFECEVGVSYDYRLPQ